MKKLFYTVVFSCLMSIGAFAQFSFGSGATLILDGSSFGVQGKAIYNVDETWSGAGTFSYIFESNVTAYSIDLDAHYKLLDVSEDFSLTPIAGLNIARVSVAGFSNTDVGLNLGAMFGLTLGEAGTNIYIEPKIVIGGWESLVISGGVLF